MDIYRADSDFLQQEVIEDYESVIWTDRYDEYGDFELVVPWSADLASNLRSLKYLTQPESDRIMMVENAEMLSPSEDEEVKQELVKLSGRSLEAFLEMRDNYLYLPMSEQTVLTRTGLPQNIIRDIINAYLVANGNAVYNIPGLVIAPTSILGEEITLTIERGTLYPQIQNVAKPYNLGFKFRKTYVSGVQTGGLTFEIYKGIDRTLVDVLTPEDNSLTDISSFESIAGYKNHVRVLGAKTAETVYPTDVPPTVAGFERRMLMVDAPDIGADSSTTVAEDKIALKLRGLEALKQQENQHIRLVDGSMAPNDLRFRNLGLGDVIWLRDSQSVQTKVRVTEKIWSSDGTGDKRYPTFEAVTDG